MLNYVAGLWLTYLVFGPWRDPAGFNFPQSAPLAPAALFPIVLEDTRLNISVFFALAAVAIGWVFMARSFVGFQLRVTGLAEGAARYAGFSTARAVWIGMLAGGFTAGIAGVGEIAGPLGTDLSDRVARLRLRGDHRGVRRPAAPARHPARRPADVVPLPRRRQRADDARTVIGRRRPVPGHDAVPAARDRRVHPLPRARHTRRRAGAGRENFGPAPVTAGAAT